MNSEHTTLPYMLDSFKNDCELCFNNENFKKAYNDIDNNIKQISFNGNIKSRKFNLHTIMTPENVKLPCVDSDTFEMMSGSGDYEQFLSENNRNDELEYKLYKKCIESLNQIYNDKELEIYNIELIKFGTRDQLSYAGVIRMVD